MSRTGHGVVTGFWLLYGGGAVRAAVVALALAFLAPTVALAQDQPPPNAAAPTDARAAYVIGMGDVLDVAIVGEPDLSHVGAAGLLVGPDGMVGLPPIGLVQAEGMTCEQLASTIREKLVSEPRWLVNPRVIVSVSSFNARKVNVIGAVARPGPYQHRPGLLVRDAIALAGGLILAGEGGASRMRARLVHADGKSTPVRLDQALSGQGPAGALELQPGDTLTVEQQLMVSVLGYVGSPGLLAVQDGTVLSEAIGLAGGVTPDGDMHLIAAKWASGKNELIDLEKIVRSGAADPALSDGDILFVPKAVKQQVSVQGYVEKPGEYEIPEGAQKTVSDVIAQAGGASPRPGQAGGGRYSSAGDLTHVTLTRDNGEVLSLNIADVLSGRNKAPDADPIVQPGDAIFVGEERNEVTVLGHVARPGRYTLVTGDKVTDALALAGGPLRPTELPARTTAADLANCTLFRASGEVVRLDLSLLPTGQPGYPNPQMLPGDTLVVPEAKNRVSIGGYVANAGYFEFRPGETVSAAVAMAGGVLPNVGSRQNVTVRHTDGASEVLDLAQVDPPLRPGDEILIAYARNRFAVVGYVQRPGLYEWHEGDTVVQAVASAGGAIPKTRNEKGGDANRAAVIRVTDGRQTITPLDLSRFYKNGDQAVNIAVLPDDVIYVPRSDHTDYGGWLGNILSGLSAYNLVKILFF